MDIKRENVYRRFNFKKYFYPMGSALALVATWQVSIYIFSIPPYLLPGPYLIIKELFSNSHLLWEHAWVTIYETFLGLGLAVIVAIPISVVVVWSKPIEKTVVPIMVFFQTIPKVAIAPLIMIWFGYGYYSIIFISFLLAYFPIAIQMIAGLQDVEPELLNLVKSMSATPLQSFIKIRIPNSLPYFFSGLKLGVLLAWSGAIMGEFMGSMKGLGFLVIYAGERSNTKLVFADLVILLVLGKVYFSLVEWIEQYVISWHTVGREREKVSYAT